MSFDATFWVAVSFVIFVWVLFYFKVHQKIFILLDESINKIKKDIEEAEKLKEEAKNVFSDYESKLDKSKVEIPNIENKLNSDERKRGWGLQLITELMDTVEYDSDETGTTVTMTKKREDNEWFNKKYRRKRWCDYN